MNDARTYRPCNGSEGEWFQSKFCYRCVKDARYQATDDGRDGCPILGATMMYDVDDIEYPKQWIDDGDGPRCTAFWLDVDGAFYRKCKEQHDERR